MLKKKIYFNLVILVLFTIIGCTDDKAEKLYLSEMAAEKSKISNDFQGTIGFELPANFDVLSSSDGEGRTEGYYEWLVFSKVEIKMPTLNIKGAPPYYPDPKRIVKGMIEDTMPDLKLKDVNLSFSSYWETEEYKYRGSLVRTKKGDYLIVKRFSKKDWRS